jgi:hypothetical protein
MCQVGAAFRHIVTLLRNRYTSLSWYQASGEAQYRLITHVKARAAAVVS